MTNRVVILGLMFVTLTSLGQKKKDLDNIRDQFQSIESEEDIEKIVTFKGEYFERDEELLIEAYKAAATCMMAEYVFSPKAKLKYFKEGKSSLEELILSEKDVEKVYLRLLLQLNVPRILNYSDDIDADLIYFDQHLAKSSINKDYKNTMIQNLLSVTKKKELRDILLQIKIEEC